MGYSYTDLWTRSDLAIDLDDAQRAQLLQQATYTELTKTLDDLADHRSQTSTRSSGRTRKQKFGPTSRRTDRFEALREPTIWNRLDFVLDPSDCSGALLRQPVTPCSWAVAAGSATGRCGRDGRLRMGRAEQRYRRRRCAGAAIPGNLVSWIPGVNVNPDDTFYLPEPERS